MSKLAVQFPDNPYEIKKKDHISMDIGIYPYFGYKQVKMQCPPMG